MRGEGEKDKLTLDAALFALNEGNLEVAEAIAARLYRNRPDEPALNQLNAVIALQRGETEQAARYAAASLARRPDHIPTLVLAGRAARAANDLAGAVGFFRRAATLAPDRADAAFLMCVTLLDLGDPAARNLLPKLFDRFPHDADGWSLLADALERADKPEAALVASIRAMGAEPSAAKYRRAGRLLQSLGRFGEAAESYRAAADLAPEDVDAAFQLGLCLRRTGDGDGARVVLERAVVLAAANGDIWFALGLVRQDQRDFEAASQAYRQALEMRPDLVEAAVNLGICLQETGDIAAAKAAYRRAVKIRPDVFGRIAQALAVAPTGELWLDVAALRSSLAER